MCIAGGRVEDLTATKAPHITSQSSDRTMVRRVMTHDHLFYQGDERDFIYVVQSGWVKLYRTLIDGQRQVVGFANPGSILGLKIGWRAHQRLRGHHGCDRPGNSGLAPG